MVLLEKVGLAPHQDPRSTLKAQSFRQRRTLELESDHSFLQQLLLDVFGLPMLDENANPRVSCEN